MPTPVTDCNPLYAEYYADAACQARVRIIENVRLARDTCRVRFECPEIARRTGIDYTRVRAVIAHLINEHHKLIGSNGKGYYVPVTPSEVAEVTKSLRHRGIMILVRAAQLQKTSLVDIWNQTYLEFERELHETNR